MNISRRHIEDKGKIIMTTAEKAGVKVHRFVWDYLDANMYAVRARDELLIIDPMDTEEAWRFLDNQGGCSVSVLLTHEHFDHINGLNRLRSGWNCTVYAQSQCSENIGSAIRNLSSVAGAIAEYSGIKIPKGIQIPKYKCDPADITFEDELSFLWCGHRLEMFSTPGHSSGSACIVLDGKLLFSGDTLFRNPVVTRFPGGSTKQYEEITIPKLRELSGQIEYVFPGHGEGGTMDELLAQCTGNGITAE